tara:strand:+ start:94 stop:786 length:693 start_codon:yes stop_codon:yes gene_type:complete
VPDYTKEYVKKKILDLAKEQDWNHQYILPGGIRTRTKDIRSPGYNLNKWARLEPIIDELEPSGKTLLDVGCSDGYYSLQCSKKGMRHVEGIDPDELRIERANFMKELSRIENAAFKVADFYNLEENNKYDIILGLGLLHRIPDITRCLEKMSNLANVLVLEFKTYDSEKDICFSGKKQMKSNKHNILHSIPTKNYVKNRLEEFGFMNNVFYNDDSHLNYKRTILVSMRGK